MTEKKHSDKPDSRILGRSRFARISAVEGLRLSYSAKKEFEDDDKKGLTPRQRRARIIAKYTEGR